MKPSAPLCMTALIAAAEGKADELAALLPDFEQATQAEPGCVEFRFFRDKANPSRFVLWEIFADQDSLTEHMGLPHTKALFAKGLIESVEVIKQEQIKGN